MKLRTRLTLFVTIAIVGIAGAIVGERALHEKMTNERLADLILEGDRNAWRAVIAGDARGLEVLVAEIARRPEIVNAVGQRDEAALREALEDPNLGADAFADTGPPPMLEVALASGQPFYTGGRPALLRPEVVTASKNLGKIASGLLLRADGEVLYAAVAPILTRFGTEAFVAASVRLEPLIAQLETVTGAEAVLLPTGALPIGPKPRFGNAVASPMLPEVGDRWELMRDDAGRAISTTRIGLQNLFGQPVGWLIARRDVTAEQHRVVIAQWICYGAAAAVLLLVIGFLQWYMRVAFRPLNEVIGVLNILGAGGRTEVLGWSLRRFQLQDEAPETAANVDEIGRLAMAVGAFQSKLSQLEEARAHKNRIESELSVATEIQRNILPTSEDAAIERRSVELDAIMEPARAVGGDLYDFFMLDQHRLFFLIGDVSDKGVPSALFMAIVRTVFKVTAQNLGGQPGAIVATANDFLVENNPSNMFVTVFAGILDMRTGRVEYCDGGHEPPFIVRNDGQVVCLEKKGGLAVGCVDGYPYEPGAFDLAPGDALLLYTDGVTEATDRHDQLFSGDRVQVVLEQGGAIASAPAVATRRLMAALREFTSGAEQSDDITILALRYLGIAPLFEANASGDAPGVDERSEREVLRHA